MEEDNSWVFDCLVVFLNGPIWSAPLDSFIEEHSLIFEPRSDQEDEEEEEEEEFDEEMDEEQHKVFNDFKNLVDFMLVNFMEEIGIGPVQFDEACRETNVPLNFNHRTFDYVWAANDYEMFKRIMVQKNVQLQLQALEMIECKFGRNPCIFLGSQERDDEELEEPSTLEQEVLNEVTKQLSQETEEESHEAEEIQQIINEEKPTLEKNLQVATQVKKACKQFFLKQQSLDLPEESIISRPAEIAKMNRLYERIPLDRPQTKMDPVDLRKRQEYLRAQRDKLVALKKEARKKRLGEEQQTRPKTSKAAERFLRFTPKEVAEALHTDVDSINYRMTLMERLKAEVINCPSGPE